MSVGLGIGVSGVGVVGGDCGSVIYGGVFSGY